MRTGMAIVKSFTNETEAQVAQTHLEALGISTVIEADNCGSMSPNMDLTCGVHLLVMGLDCEKAVAILSEMVEEPASGNWVCGSCGEKIEAGYDACWKCGTKK